jgi:hypothetical protein
MGQVLTTGKPGLPATYHGDLNVFSLCSDRMHTADAMERGWGAGRPEPLPSPTLDNAPISDVADAPLLDKRCDASGL